MEDYPNPFGTTILLQRDFMIGAIVIWSGLVSTIPAGWQLCDGTNGTPDLRAVFVRGAWDDPSVGSAGGQNSHEHTFNAGNHRHDLKTSVGPIQGSGVDFQDETFLTNVSGTTDPEDNRPEFYTLAYIQRLS